MRLPFENHIREAASSANGTISTGTPSTSFRECLNKSTGALGGGVAGNAIETKLCRVTVWATTVVFKDGTVRSYERDSGQAVEPGDIVIIADGRPARVQR